MNRHLAVATIAALAITYPLLGSAQVPPSVLAIPYKVYQAMPKQPTPVPATEIGKRVVGGAGNVIRYGAGDPMYGVGNSTPQTYQRPNCRNPRTGMYYPC